jgi:predicted esterase
MFAFGGGFIQGSRTDSYVVTACKRLAAAGYVSVAMDYRYGISLSGILNPTAELMRVFFRPIQDFRASIQYMKASKAELGNPYRIDTSRIIIGGASAGAITALNVAYCDKESEFAEIGSLSSISSLGGFYSSSGYYPNYTWSCQAVLNIAGALVNADWIESGDVPLISAHGDQDNTVSYQGGNLNLGFSQLGLEGSYNLNARAESIGVCSYLYTMTGEGHPSGNADDNYLNKIFFRAFPRMAAVIRNKSFCCSLPTVELGSELVEMVDTNMVELDAQVSVGNVVNWCSYPCGASLSGTGGWVNGSEFPYVIVYTEDSTCLSTDYVQFLPVSTVGVSSYEGNKELNIYPNPTTGFIEGGVVGRYRVVDRFGRVLKVGSGNGSLELSGLASGVYWILIDGRKATRIVLISL